MPPKRRPAAPPTKEKTPRQSALAKEHGISSATEAEIKESFNLFSTAKDSLPSISLRRALAALNVPASSQKEYRELLSAADPEDEGTISYANYVAIAALKLNARGEDEVKEEVRDGFELFLRMGGAAPGEDRITAAMLKRIAGLLNEDVKVEVLRDMMREANGGAGIDRGIDIDEFEGVMRRAGIFR